ncbi:hypothetical protein L195_g036619 [Trifolium pratense]|uniref:Uncharacterized protein n=1 Tax=Trifolium pratense TaxID=57577 RepID=A0A2K3LQ23_TRIPR|nr:hypothetical protein L195_g036619 [Trifolium pratense]
MVIGLRRWGLIDAKKIKKGWVIVAVGEALDDVDRSQEVGVDQCREKKEEMDNM